MAIMGAIIWKRGLNNKSIENMTKKAVKFETRSKKILIAVILGFAIGLMTGILGAGGGG